MSICKCFTACPCRHSGCPAPPPPPPCPRPAQWRSGPGTQSGGTSGNWSCGAASEDRIIIVKNEIWDYVCWYTCLGEDSVTLLEVVSTPEEAGDLHTAWVTGRPHSAILCSYSWWKIINKAIKIDNLENDTCSFINSFLFICSCFLHFSSIWIFLSFSLLRILM